MQITLPSVPKKTANPQILSIASAAFVTASANELRILPVEQAVLFRDSGLSAIVFSRSAQLSAIRIAALSCITHSFHPTVLLPNSEPMPPTQKASPALFEKEINRAASFLESSPLSASFRAAIAPIGKPPMDPSRNIGAPEDGMPVAFSNILPIIRGIIPEIPVEQIKLVSTINGKSDGISFDVQSFSESATAAAASLGCDIRYTNRNNVKLHTSPRIAGNVFLTLAIIIITAPFSYHILHWNKLNK